MEQELEKISGTVEDVTYHNEESGFTVLLVDVDGDPVTVVGEVPEIAEGEEITATGSYKVHGTYGVQFRAELIERTLPATAGAIRKYLSSGAVKGLGPALAGRIVARFGDDTLTIIEKEPERLTEVRGISAEKARKIGEEYLRQLLHRQQHPPYRGLLRDYRILFTTVDRAVEEILYPAMEDYAIDIIIGKGPSANSIRLDLPHFTLIGATTRAGQLSSPLRDRFGVQLRLELYTTEELQRIVMRSAALLGIEIEPAGAREIASRSRGTPRIANRLLRRVRDFAQVCHDGVITSEAADHALSKLEVDHLGLDAVDRRMLTAIVKNYGGGPVGLETLAATIADLGRVRRDSLVEDPFCGSGTLLIEAAQKAMNIAPGLKRRFAAERYSFVPAAVWAEQRQKALAESKLDVGFEAFGYDIDPAAVALANANAKLAGVEKRCHFEVADVADFAARSEAIVLTNPPYGERMSTIEGAAKLARTLGQQMELHPCAGVYAITADMDFEHHYGKRANKRRKMYNGMIPCQLYMYYNAPKSEQARPAKPMPKSGFDGKRTQPGHTGRFEKK